SQSSREPSTFPKLLAEARAGSAEALGKILISFTTELHKRAEPFVHPPSLQAKGNAADLVQTTFVEAQRNLEQFHGTTREEFVRPINGSLDIQGVTSVMTRVDGRQLGGRRQLLECMNQIAPALEATAGMRNLDDCSRRAY